MTPVDTRARLLDAALRLFHEKKCGSTSIADILQAAMQARTQRSLEPFDAG